MTSNFSTAYFLNSTYYPHTNVEAQSQVLIYDITNQDDEIIGNEPFKFYSKTNNQNESSNLTIVGM